MNRVVVLAFALVAATLLAFAPVVSNEFINYDDDINLTKNLKVQQGLTLESLRWAFTNVEYQNWHPLTWISHILDFQLFGMQAGGHHVVSVFIHAVSAALLFAVFNAMTGALWRSLLVAALFALHPLRVESVAWAAERKDVLTVFFGIVALGAYLRFARRRLAGSYAASLIFFSCALMSKAMLVTFPALLLLLDLWPLGRWSRSQSRAVPFLPGRGIVFEKLPFFALSAAASVLAFYAQASGGAVGYVIQFPLAQRVANAFRSHAVYLGKLLWPTKLAVFYPYFWADVPWWQPALGVVLVVAISAAVIMFLRRRPAYFVGWAWYLGTSLPVIGIIQVGSQSLADRYTYLPQIGLVLIIAWGLGDLCSRWPKSRTAVIAASALALAALSAATWAQVTRWRSSETLFTHALSVTQDNYIALSNLGTALAEKGRETEGSVLIRRAFEVNPMYRTAVFDRAGDYYAKRGLAREAAEQYRKALAIEPYNRTIQGKLSALGEGANAPSSSAQATEDPHASLRGKPGGNPHDGLPRAPAGSQTGAAAPRNDFERGNFLVNAGRREEAVAAYREAVRKEPGNFEAWNNLGCALGELGRRAESIAAFEETLRLKPDNMSARTNLKQLRR